MTAAGDRRFERKRARVFAVLFTAYVMVYFHRFAPGAVSQDLKKAFDLTAASLGSLAAMYFYIYAVMQIPSGVLADSLGPRKTVVAGNFLAGMGSILFGLAPTLAVASAGRLLVGLGVSVIFVAVMKSNAMWFSEARYARMGGLTLLVGNLGSVLAVAPLAFLVGILSWRAVFVTLGAFSILLAWVGWRTVRDRPEHCGFQAVVDSPDGNSGTTWREIRRGLFEVGSHRTTWAIFLMNFGITGGLYAFMGLWGVRLLSDAHGMTDGRASGFVTVMLFAFAFGCVFFGWLSDRLRLRKAVMLVGNIVYLLFWCLFWWWMPSEGPLLDQLWRGELSEGVRIYRGESYQDATLLMVGFALLAVLATFFMRETRCRM